MIRYLDQGYRQRHSLIVGIKADPRFGSIRSDRQYQALLHKLNLE